MFTLKGELRPNVIATARRRHASYVLGGEAAYSARARPLVESSSSGGGCYSRSGVLCGLSPMPLRLLPMSSNGSCESSWGLNVSPVRVVRERGCTGIIIITTAAPIINIDYAYSSVIIIIIISSSNSIIVISIITTPPSSSSSTTTTTGACVSSPIHAQRTNDDE